MGTLSGDLESKFTDFLGPSPCFHSRGPHSSKLPPLAFFTAAQRRFMEPTMGPRTEAGTRPASYKAYTNARNIKPKHSISTRLQVPYEIAAGEAHFHSGLRKGCPSGSGLPGRSLTGDAQSSKQKLVSHRTWKKKTPKAETVDGTYFATRTPHVAKQLVASDPCRTPLPPNSMLMRRLQGVLSSGINFATQHCTGGRGVAPRIST